MAKVTRKSAVVYRKTKFINSQRHIASCGPVAVANLLKWYGIQTSYSAVLKYCKATGVYEPKIGMFPKIFGLVLKRLKIKYRLRRRVTLKLLNDVLKKKGVIILIYVTKVITLHCVVIDLKTKKSYRIWNSLERTKPWYPKSSLSMSLKRSIRYGQLYAYLIFNK